MELRRAGVIGEMESHDAVIIKPRAEWTGQVSVQTVPLDLSRALLNGLCVSSTLTFHPAAVDMREEPESMRVTT